jgi:hypothetical protein
MQQIQCGKQGSSKRYDAEMYKRENRFPLQKHEAPLVTARVFRSDSQGKVAHWLARSICES